MGISASLHDYNECLRLVRRFCNLRAASRVYPWRRNVPGDNWSDVIYMRNVVARLEKAVLEKAAAQLLDLRYPEARALVAAGLAIKTGMNVHKCRCLVEKLWERGDRQGHGLPSAVKNSGSAL